MSNPAFEFDHIHLIAPDPQATAKWYIDHFGADLVADTVARGAPQIFLELGGKTLIVRGQRKGESPKDPASIEPFDDFSSHNHWGTDHFGFLYHGDLSAFCKTLAAAGVTFPVPLKRGVGDKVLCYVAAPDGVSIELMEA